MDFIFMIILCHPHTGTFLQSDKTIKDGEIYLKKKTSDPEAGKELYKKYVYMYIFS